MPESGNFAALVRTVPNEPDYRPAFSFEEVPDLIER